MRRLLCIVVLIAPSLVHAGAQISVADLAWTTGTWVGPMGEQTLTETWLPPGNGILACAVQLSSGGSTNVYELIVIEEEAETLVFRVRQWRPGFEPLDPPGQTMVLSELGDRRVTFEAVGPGNFQTLSYSRPQDDRFQIAVQTQDGGSFEVQLRLQP